MKVRSVVVRREWDCMLVDLEASSLSSYTLRCVSLAELGTVCRVGLREKVIKFQLFPDELVKENVGTPPGVSGIAKKAPTNPGGHFHSAVLKGRIWLQHKTK